MRGMVVMTPASGGAALLRSVYAVSDVHTDHEENMQWVRDLGRERFSRDVLIVAGDVSESIPRFSETMRMFKSAFAVVFFVAGNHDLWLKKEEMDTFAHSIDKLERLHRVCESLGILTTPQHVQLESGPVAILPLLSFHHASFDTEPDVHAVRMPRVESAVTDYRACRWPHPFATGDVQLAEAFDTLNDHQLARAEWQAEANECEFLSPITDWSSLEGRQHPILSFSHFLPRIDLCPEKRYLRYANLMKAVGSAPLGSRVAAIRPHVHVFGHTHFGWDAQIGDVRYVQAALGTPRERRQRMRSLAIGQIYRKPLKVYDGERADFCPPFSAAWSNHYAMHGRQPSNVEPAPWVRARRKAS